MKAKKMFEDLGYEETTSLFTIYGNKYNKSYYNNEKEVGIFFRKNRLAIRNDSGEWFTMEELKAINRQIEELGW